jgi:hypothetical protein
MRPKLYPGCLSYLLASSVTFVVFAIAAGGGSGRENQLHVPAPRLDAPAAIVKVDGVLDEEAWRQAALLTGFSQYSPVDGRPADNQTDVLVFYSATTIYFGVKAHAAPGAVHATLANRDRIDADDSIQIFLNPFNDGRRALVFGVKLQSYERRSDGSKVGVRRIPRLTVEYQVSRPIFLRVIGEYDSRKQDALRDDSRTELPISDSRSRDRTLRAVNGV